VWLRKQQQLKNSDFQNSAQVSAQPVQPTIRKIINMFLDPFDVLDPVAASILS
jgi:hypothetical protein